MTPLRIFLVLASLAISVGCSAQQAAPRTEALESAPTLAVDGLAPHDWLVIARVDPDEPGIAKPDAVFARYLLDSSAAPPRAGEVVRGSAGTEAVWRSTVLATDGRVPDGTAWAYASIAAESAGVWLARLEGAGVLFVNGTGFAGDARSEGHVGVPVALRAGRNDLFVGDIRGPLRLELSLPKSRIVLGASPVRKPTFVAGVSVFPDDWVTFPVLNASLESVSRLHLHYWGELSELPERLGDGLYGTSQWDCGNGLAPLGVLQYGLPGNGDGFPAAGTFPYPIRAWADSDAPIGAAGYLQVDIEVLTAPAQAVPVPIGMMDRSSFGGPFAEYPEGCVMLVYGANGTAQETQELLARARFDLETYWQRSARTPFLFSDEQFLEPKSNYTSFLERFTVILYGNEDTNRAMRVLLPERTPIRVGREGVRVDERELEGSDLACVFALARTGKFDEKGCIGVVGNTGVAGARLGYSLQPLVADWRGLDYAIVSTAALTGRGAGVLERGRISAYDRAIPMPDAEGSGK